MANDILVKVGADITDFSRKMAESNRALSNFSRANAETFDAFKKTGAIVTGAGTALATGLGLAVTEAIKFEDSFAGVRKTVDASEAEFAALEQGFRDLSKEIPASIHEINAVGEAAGQLGIEKENILEFTRTMIDLGVATNMSSDEAATALARLANITGMPQTEFDRLGATIVDLGNNLATTESEIVEMGLRLAGAGAQVGMTEAQIMSFAGALSSVGIEAEAGGSAFSKVMINMQLAAERGGKDLENFAKVAGMSADEFKQAYEQDAAGAMMTFIEGLSTVEDRGMSAIGVLDEMGITEVRMRDALLRAAGASDVFTEALEIGTNAWEENTALSNEAAERYKTVMSQLKILGNTVRDVAISFGDALMPAIQLVIGWLQKLSDWFSGLSESTKSTIAIFTAVASAIMLIVGPILLLVGFIPTIISGFAAFKTVVVAVGAALGGISAPVLIVIGLIGALIAALVVAWQKSEAFREGVTIAFEAVREVVMTVIGAVVDFVMEIWGGMVEWWQENNELIMRVVQDGWERLQVIIEAVMGFIVPFIQDAWERIVMYIEIAWEVIKTVVRIATEIIKGVITAWLHILDGDWSSAWETIKQTFSNIWDIMKGFIKNVTKIIKNTIKDRFEQVKQNITDKLTEAKNNLVNKFTEMVTNAINKAQEIVSTVRQKFEEVKERIREKLTEAVQVVGEKIGEMPGKVKEFVSDMIFAGVELIQGLIDGIKTMTRAAIEAITGVVNGVIEKAKSLLKISSPSRLFKQYGQWTGEGLADGITQSIRTVERASERMIDAMMPERKEIDLSYATPSGIKTSLASAVSGTVDVKSRDDALVHAIYALEHRLTNLEVVMDGREVGRIVEPYVTEEQERNQSVMNRFRG